MKQDKFLTGILIGVFVLIVVALALFFVRDSERTYLAENTPDAVVYNYVLALQSGDYEKAYGYLPESYEEETRPSFAAFRSYFSYDYNQVNDVGINIISVDEEGDYAWVTVETLYAGGGLFGSAYRYQETAILIKDEAGAWKLIHMPYEFWGWEWFGDSIIYR